MKLIDLHCDTASKLLYTNSNFKKNQLSVDIKKLKKANSMAQVFAFFIDGGRVKDLFIEFQVMYKNFINEVNKNSEDIILVKSIQDLEEANNKNKIGALLSIEEGDVLQGSLENLDIVYNMGIRIITLTWNYKNKIGYPNYHYIYKNKGLTDFGRELVYKMEEKGIIPDSSHLSDKGFYDLIEICKKPFIASHSNSREITNHYRNLSDDMIKALANKGGIIGINFCADFLGNSKKALIEDMVKHINHIKNIGGINCVSLGSDFDGIENHVDIEDIGQIEKLEIALRKVGYSYDEIEKIFYKNTLRIFKENLKE